MPAVNQVELHPYCQQRDAVAFFQKHGLAVTAYSPIGSPGFGGKGADGKELNLMQEPLILEIARAHNKSPAQICLNWNLNRNVIVIPKTMNVARLGENLNCYDFKLSEEEYKAIDNLERGVRFFNPINWAGATFNNAAYFD